MAMNEPAAAAAAADAHIRHYLRGSVPTNI